MLFRANSLLSDVILYLHDLQYYLKYFCICKIGQETLEQEFYDLMTSTSSSSSFQDDNDVFDCLRKEVLAEVKKRRRWDAEAENNLVCNFFHATFIGR